MTAPVNKVIVTNRAALGRKYGGQQAAIDQALQRLVAADAARGLRTVVANLADPAEMKSYGGTAVTNVQGGKQNKAAVDAVYRSLTPEYLVILGSVDVVPHQNLGNPVGDDDRVVPSDLPYACERDYSWRATDFLGPTRVVGRLPDVAGATSPVFLLGLLDIAANYQCRPRADYESYLGISAKVWQQSTAASLRAIFGDSNDLQTSPLRGPDWSQPPLLARRAHFINCHGAPATPHFYGQSGTRYPVAHSAAKLADQIAAGTIVAAECCYGSELYRPALAHGVLGICSEYLRSGAYGFFGSTTIAYGPTEGNSEADIITQDFLKHVLAGASLGRAALQARQDFVLKNAVLDPCNLKTLAQFVLLGDPSIQPVQKADVDPAPAGAKSAAKSAAGAKWLAGAAALAAGRAARRETLLKNGLALAGAANFAKTATAQLTRRAASAIQRQLAQALGEVDELIGFQSLNVFAPKAAQLLAGKLSLPRLRAPNRVHLALGRSKAGQAPCDQFVAAVARELDGVIFDVRTLVSR